MTTAPPNAARDTGTGTGSGIAPRPEATAASSGSSTSPTPRATGTVDDAGHAWRYCPNCATPLALLTRAEDGGDKTRLRCPTCDWTHWNNPTPVLAAIVECADREGRVLLARNAAWTNRMFALITGFMEAGETPEEGIAREVREETQLMVEKLALVGVYDFQRRNQLIVAYHAVARGEIRLSPELVEYKLFRPQEIRCWRAGTGYAVADWLRGRGIEPQWADALPSTAPAPSPPP